jgi:hypothetical protein
MYGTRRKNSIGGIDTDELRAFAGIAATIGELKKVAAEALSGQAQEEKAQVVDDKTLHRGEFKGVSASYLRLAEKTVIDLAAQLGITPPVIRWHADTTQRGWVVTGTHEINLSTAVAENWPKNWAPLHWLLAHELRHLWQDANSRHLGDRDAEERDAEEWATQQTGWKDFHPYYLRRP